MANATSIRKPRRTAEEIRYIAAVLTGIYASNGLAILSAKNHEYHAAQRNVRRVAIDQADQLMRRSS